MMLNIVRKPIKKFPVNPRIRAYGKARLDIVSRVQTSSDWDRLWKRPAYPFPFTWGAFWKQCIEYKVDDFAAEVGFYTDILGLPVNALDSGYAMFTSPGGDFFIAIVPSNEGSRSTPPDAIRIQFMVADVFATAGELERRGISFEQWPQPCAEGSSLYIGYFRTPHGICVDLWGQVEIEVAPNLAAPTETGEVVDSNEQQEINEFAEEANEDPEDENESPDVSDQNSIEQPDEEVQSGLDETEHLVEVEYVDEENG